MLLCQTDVLQSMWVAKLIQTVRDSASEMDDPICSQPQSTYLISSLSVTYSDAAPTADGSRVIKISIMLLLRLQL